MNGGLRFMQGGAPQGGFSCGFAAIHLLPYGMGKSINFTPALQNAVQSKKEAPETGASLRLL
ncbi:MULTISPECIES: hypothetical protein [Agathobaculum]|uniref:hypothetical protein n=1 Tax=Agathobaculum TaxID=2048137 RepID=UPI001C00A2F1|nr:MULTISPECIES: hypothetical protein [Butyricicoccus]MBT9816574.1 hypothetical protein [Butyricicoccus faecihominis]